MQKLKLSKCQYCGTIPDLRQESDYINERTRYFIYFECGGCGMRGPRVSGMIMKEESVESATWVWNSLFCLITRASRMGTRNKYRPGRPA